jgi:hypothetical protein
MTKKDYVKIAAALAQHAPSGAPAWAKSADADCKRAMARVWSLCCTNIADVMAGDNPRFDRARFYAACGLEG